MIRLLCLIIFHLSHLQISQCKWHRTFDIEYCPSPPEIPNAFPMPESWDGIDKMKQAFLTYKCETGYSHQGDISIYCVKRRHMFSWSKPAFTCNPVSCTPPINPKNGKSVGTNFTYGDFISYECDVGYNLYSSDGRNALATSPMQVCTSNGTWSGHMPQCIVGYLIPEVVCPYPDVLPNGYSIYTSREIGGKLMVQCNDGFRKHGESEPICSSTGKWEGELPTCVEEIKPKIVEKFQPDSINQIKGSGNGLGIQIWKKVKDFFTFQ